MIWKRVASENCSTWNNLSGIQLRSFNLGRFACGIRPEPVPGSRLRLKIVPRGTILRGGLRSPRRGEDGSWHGGSLEKGWVPKLFHVEQFEPGVG
jgi:hypothetical protein